MLEKDETDYTQRVSGLRFPVLIKTVRACGAADAHHMSVAFSEKGLHHPDLRAPLIVQEYLNHGAVIWKIFVIGDYVAVVPRPSLCDLALDPARPNITFNSQKGVPPELLAAQPGKVPQPPQRVLESMASWLSARTGMTLFGFDVVVHEPVAGKLAYGVIDINYFPGYSGVPDFNERLLSHALRVAGEKDKNSTAAVGGKRPLESGEEEQGEGEEEGGDEEAEEAEGAAHGGKVARGDEDADKAKEGTEASADPAEAKMTKRRIALCLSYNGALLFVDHIILIAFRCAYHGFFYTQSLGAGYLGMQKNPAVKTIEGDLEKALFQTGRISATNYGNLAKVAWQRCARTDKGVSAQGQIVSLKALLKSDDVRPHFFLYRHT